MASKYEVLAAHLRASRESQLQMTFSQVADLLGELPASAWSRREWWSNNESHTHARNGWLAAGWKTSKVHMPSKSLTFVRNTGRQGSVSGRNLSPGESRVAQRLLSLAGGEENLSEIVAGITRYVAGEIVETELGRIIRRFWGRRA
jgi:hypothetical protein